ncbi:discoidin domain-containing protein [Lysinibacillus sp. M3]|uniref:Discoidin domain-containing protein n=1 Tax=Lysinibacillus zambalensis TaxID=3160866 RepID=A0ABV1MRY7_9BACI
MATIGQTLPQPEIGWKRYDDRFSLIKYTGDWIFENTVGYYNGTVSHVNQGSIGARVDFYFYGTKIRIIANQFTNKPKDIKIIIDGKLETFSEYTTITSPPQHMILSYEKTGLEKTLHKVEIVSPDDMVGKSWNVDAIDIDNDGEIRPPYRKAILENENQYYSLDDETLIHLPNTSNESIISLGIEQGKEIALNVPFTKQNYVNESPILGISNKIFSQKIGEINTLRVKEQVKEWNSIYTWHETKMTSNTTPSPLVASASGEYNTTYQAWKAFDGTKDVSAWLTVANTTTGWIKLDLGRKVITNALKMTCRGGSTDAITRAMPKDFEIYGSNDDLAFTLLGSFKNQTDWKFLEERVFELGNSLEYRYFRFNILSNNGFPEYSNIGELLYGYKREVK